MNCKWASLSCVGETCSQCANPATHKVEETIFEDDPHPIRHPLTAYLCCFHFSSVMGPTAPCYGFRVGA